MDFCLSPSRILLIQSARFCNRRVSLISIHLNNNDEKFWSFEEPLQGTDPIKLMGISLSQITIRSNAARYLKYGQGKEVQSGKM